MMDELNELNEQEWLYVQGLERDEAQRGGYEDDFDRIVREEEEFLDKKLHEACQPDFCMLGLDQKCPEAET